ncbi:C-type lectin domain family 4 member E-like [Spinachia spinachia]
MIRVQRERFSSERVLIVEVMEPQYHQFGPMDQSTSAQNAFTGMKRIVVCVLYGVLVLLLLILLMVNGIKFSQLNKEITDVKLNLRILSKRTSSSTPDATTVREVLLTRRVPVKGTCREGWMSFQTGCYWLSTTAATWSKAEDRCREQGGHLVVLNNVEELDYISEVVDIKYSYWIGLVERDHEGHWSWVDGTDFSSTPTFWDNGQPDNWENGEDCGQIHASERRKRKMWNDADCHRTFKYVCETRA